ncbi:MAG: endonuclease III [Synergistaceae bacterium]|nr:endonuclease III [Synergistaceae bacterium]MBR0315402.1 endonuclease III [Synergistaceae bacterium]
MIFKVLERLEALYHNEACPPVLGHEEPLDGLILTIISQNTNDKNRDSAFENLKNFYPTWKDVINAGAENLEKAIKTAGLANTKSKRIIYILEKIYQDFGEYSLKKLAENNSPEYIKNYLRNLPGVGAKTVACVLLFDLGLKAFPVDTHVTRVSKRVGIAPEKFSPEEISEMFEKIIPLSKCLGGHVNIICHGRAVCHSRKPDCENCVLSDLCRYKKTPLV